MQKIINELTIVLVLLSLLTCFMTGCDSKKKEIKQYADLITSRNATDLRAYLAEFKKSAPPEHVIKIQKILKHVMADSSAFSEIKKAKGLDAKLQKENEYFKTFPQGDSITMARELYAKDKRAWDINRVLIKVKNNIFCYRYTDYGLYPALIKTYYVVFAAPDKKGQGDMIVSEIYNTTDTKKDVHSLTLKYEVKNDREIIVKTNVNEDRRVISSAPEEKNILKLANDVFEANVFWDFHYSDWERDKGYWTLCSTDYSYSSQLISNIPKYKELMAKIKKGPLNN